MTDTTTGTRQPRGERGLSRRGALRAGARGLAAAGGVAATAGVAAARRVEVFADAKPDSVDIQFDREWLERYRPLLDTRHVPFDNRPTLHAWRVTSRDPDVETEVGVYCCEYAVQEDLITLTSHPGDHEWVYVYVNPSTGEVSEVSYTAYHWLRGYVLNPPVYGDRPERHPMLRIAPTYHNYVPMQSATDTSVLLDPRSLGDYDSRSGPLYQWLANGLKADMEPGAVHNPWLLDSDGPLDAWWREDISGVNAWILDTWTWLSFSAGIAVSGAENADFGDARTPS